jgi:two-component system cell cycle sensor histidine kinase/response regulator CckA
LPLPIRTIRIASFNNMLGVIVGHTELALGEIDSAQSAYHELQEVMKAAHRSADLVRQLLAFARKQTISPTVLNINETVESMLKMVRRLIGEDVALVWKPGADMRSVKVDPVQIHQILANLCVNACDAIEGVGKLTIETGTVTLEDSYCREHAAALPGDYVLLSVRDTGCGMDEETLGKLFEPFFTTKEVGKGTGLGLATVYGIVKQNNGFIDVHSNPGRGTTFRIFFPPTDAPAAEKQPAKPQKKSLNGNETVLLVEDEESILMLGKTILERYGYSVLASQSPGKALIMAKDHPGPIQLLISDVVMPGLNGKGLREKLNALRPGLKCIFMSWYSADIIADHGVIDEGIDFLQKPFSVDTLTGKVREVLDG